MGKIYKGYELIKAIEDRQIKKGTKFKIIDETDGYTVTFKYDGNDRLYFDSGELVEACYFIDTKIQEIVE